MSPLGFSAPAPSVGDSFIDPIWITACSYTAGIIFVLLAAIAFLLLCIDITSKKRGGEYKLRPITFSLLLLLCSLEAAFWFVLPTPYWKIGPLYYFLSSFPLALYCIVLFLCMYLFGTIFYQVYFTNILSDYEISLRQQRRAKIQVVVSIMAVSMQVTMYVLSFFISPSVYEHISSLVTGVSTIVAGSFFFFYAVYLVHRRRSVSPQDAARPPRYQHRLLQCASVTILASACAIIRGVSCLFWRQIATVMSRQLFWCFATCLFAAFEALPVFMLLVLFRVMSLQSVVVVGTPDSQYWNVSSSRSVEGHDFSLIDNKENAKSAGEESSIEEMH